MIESLNFLFLIGKAHNFRKYNVSQIDSLGVPYDYISVMHYSPTAFGISGSTTIKAKNSFVIQLGQRIGLSPKDVTQADLLYRCNGEKQLRKPRKSNFKVMFIPVTYMKSFLNDVFLYLCWFVENGLEFGMAHLHDGVILLGSIR